MYKFFLIVFIIGIPVLSAAQEKGAGGNTVNIPYFGQTINIRVKRGFPVAVHFDEVIHQAIWDEGVVGFAYKPDLGELNKQNFLVFFASIDDPAPARIHLVIGDRPDSLEVYSLNMIKAIEEGPSKIIIQDRRKTRSKPDSKTINLMALQDDLMTRMLFAIAYGDGIENFTVDYINRKVREVDNRTILLESAIKENITLRISSKETEQIGIYLVRLAFCNTSHDEADPIYPETLKEMFHFWEMIAYDYDEIAPQTCMSVDVISKRDKEFYEEYIAEPGSQRIKILKN